MDYYQLLGLSRTCTTDEVKKAFRKLAMELHPDKNPSPDAQAHFLLIRRAYDVLSNPQLRSEYDRLLVHLASQPAPPVYTRSYQRVYKEPLSLRTRLRVLAILMGGLLFFSVVVVGGGYLVTRDLSHRHYLAGLDALSKGQKQEALSEFLAAITYYYKEQDCLYQLAKVELELEQYGAAREHIQMAMQVAKTIPDEYWRVLAKSLLGLHRYESAAQALAGLPPDDALVLFIRAKVLLYAQNKPFQAIAVLDKLLKKDTLRREAWLEKAHAQYLAGLYLESNQSAIEALRWGEGGDIYFQFALNAIALGDTSSCCQHLRLALAMGFAASSTYLEAYCIEK